MRPWTYHGTRVQFPAPPLELLPVQKVGQPHGFPNPWGCHFAPRHILCSPGSPLNAAHRRPVSRRPSRVPVRRVGRAGSQPDGVGSARGTFALRRRSVLHSWPFQDLLSWTVDPTATLAFIGATTAMRLF